VHKKDYVITPAEFIGTDANNFQNSVNHNNVLGRIQTVATGTQFLGFPRTLTIKPKLKILAPKPSISIIL